MREHPELKLQRSSFHDPAVWWAVRETRGLITDRWPIDEHSRNQLEVMLKANQIVHDLAEVIDEFTPPELRADLEQWLLLADIVEVARPEPADHGSGRAVTPSRGPSKPARARWGYRHLRWALDRDMVTVHRNLEVSDIRSGELVGRLEKLERGWSATCWCKADVGSAPTQEEVLSDLFRHHKQMRDKQLAEGTD